MKKKILALVIIATMLFSVSVSAYEFSYDVLNSLGAIPSDLKQNTENPVYRDEFAQIAAGLAGIKTGEASDTAFSDVTKENKYSGAVQAVFEAGFMSGVGNGFFGAETPVTGQQALAVFIRITGYDVIADYYGGWPEGYTKISQKLGLLKAFSRPVTEPLVYSDLWELLDLVMEMPTASVDYTDNNGDIGQNFYIREDAPSYMNDKMGISMYEGVIKEVDNAEYSCVVKITSSEEGLSYSEGETVTLKVSPAIKIAAYDKMQAELYVDSEGMLLCIVPAKTSEVKYTVIHSVNGDDRDNIKYRPSAIKSLMFLDDKREYRVNDDFRVYYNGKLFTDSIELSGKFARTVFFNGNVSSIEVWDMTEGGLITEVNYDRVVFRKGESVQRITGLDYYKDRILILDEEIRQFSELKPGTVFDYYINKDESKIIIFASEKKISDVLVSMGDDTIEIGNLSILRVDNVYASADGEKYDTDTLKDLMRTQVTAYTDVMGRVRFVLSGTGEIGKNDFTGYFLAYEGSKLSDNLKKFKIVNLDGEEFTETIYTVADRFSTDENLEEILASAGRTDGTQVYDFKVNSKGEITSMSKTTAFYGFADTNGEAKVQSIGSFPQSAFPYMWVGGKRLYFDDDVKIVGMYEKDGELKFRKIRWNSLSGKECDNAVTARFFGEELSSDVSMILLTGPLDTIVPMENNYGIITKITDTRLPDGEFGKKIVINNTNSYLLGYEDAAGLEKNTFVNYSSGTLLGENEVCILNKLNLSGGIFDWVGASNTSVSVKMGTVQKIDEKRVYFTDGSAWFINRSNPLFFSVAEDNTMTEGSYMDNLEGKDIVYIADNYLVHAIFYTV